MICSNCHKEIGDAAFCPHCGASVLKAPMLHHLPVGTLIGGRYRVEGVLGEGGFGITYLTRDSKLGHAVAVKEYYPRGFSYRSNTGTNEVYVSSQEDAAFYEHGKERFLSEAKTLARFSEEPGVVSVTDYIEENNTVYLVMEYLRGVTLQQYLKQHGNLSADAAFSMLEPVMKTLEKIHAAGVIHRDISPDNIMVLQNGQLKLMDFGAAKEFVDDNRSMSVMLKKGYAPIEQYRRNGKQGPWTDVYALCATIYRCITGKTPEDSLDRVVEDELQKPSKLGAIITPEQENALLKGLAVRQNDRYQTVTELLGSFEQPNLYCPPGSMDPSEENEKTDPNATILADPRPRIMVDPPWWHEEVSDTPQKEPAAKKKGKKAIIISAVAAVLVVAIVVGLLIFNPFKTKEKNSQTDEVEETTVEETWSGITAVSTSWYHTVCLKNDGTVVVSGDNEYGKCEVGNWADIVAVSAGYQHTVGLKKDGTVLATGWNDDGQCNVGSWTDIVAISAGYDYTVGLKMDGTVVVTGDNEFGQCDTDDWRDIIDISTGDFHTVGLKMDGTVLATGTYYYGQCNVDDWTDIIAISAGGDHTVGLKQDGTVVAVGLNSWGQCDVDGWTDITAISAGHLHSVGLKKDGTAVAVGSNEYGESDVGSWTDITAIATGLYETVGVKKDGTVVTIG